MKTNTLLDSEITPNRVADIIKDELCAISYENLIKLCRYAINACYEAISNDIDEGKDGAERKMSYQVTEDRFLILSVRSIKSFRAYWEVDLGKGIAA